MKTIAMRAAALLAALLLLALSPCALAGDRYPVLRGTVTDDAGVLSDSVRQDLITFQERLDAADAGVTLYVALVDFLDGETAQAYADAVFAKAALGEEAVLVLGAAGEDAYAVTAGKSAAKALGASKLNDLFVSSGFAARFMAQQYDAAFGLYAAGFAKLAGTVSVAGLFGQAEPTATAAPVSDYDLDSFIDDFFDSLAGKESAPAAQEPERARERESEGLSPLGWIVLVLLVMLIFGQSDGARKARKVAGCGCSPLGYLVGALGLGKLLGGRRGRR